KSSTAKKSPQAREPLSSAYTDKNGCCVFNNVPAGTCEILCRSFNKLKQNVTVESGCTSAVCFEDPIQMKISAKKALADCTLIDCNQTTVNSPLRLIGEITGVADMSRIGKLHWSNPS